MLYKNLHVQLEVKTLNPATLLRVNSGPLEIMDEVFSSHPGLINQPISHPEIEYWMDGNSFVQKDTHFAQKDTHFARYTVVTLDLVIKNMTTASRDF
jgi:hypothetical protein